MKKSILFSILFSIISLMSIAQSTTMPYVFWNTDMLAIAEPESKEGLVKFKNTVSTPIEQILNTHKSAFGLTVNDNMVLIKNWTSKNGTEHFKYLQEYSGISVIGGSYVLHKSLDGKIIGSGNVIRNITVNGTPNFTIDSIIKVIKNDLPSTLPSQALAIHNDFPNDVRTNHKLTFMETGGTMKLVYLVKVYNSMLDFFYLYIIDAQNGTIISSRNQITEFDVELPTLAYDTQTFEYSIEIVDTTYIDSVYYDPVTFDYDTFLVDTTFLHFASPYDSTRGNGIDAIGKFHIDIPGQDYSVFARWALPLEIYGLRTDWITGDHDPSFFEHFKRAFQTYWATQNAYDLLLNEYGVNSIDGNGKDILLITVDNPGPIGNFAGFFNTGFNLTDTAYIWFQGDNYSKVSIAFHEYAHGIMAHQIGENYGNVSEFHILNEGFADIFSCIMMNKMSQKPNLDFNDIKWTSTYELYNPVFEQHGIDHNRYMEEPKRSNDPIFPDYYQGDYWLDIDSFPKDAYSHQNLTVLSHWFYLISEGTLKTNEVGETYYIPGIGFQAASDIIMDVILNNYIDIFADFHTMREKTIESAASIDSCFLKTLYNAWDCVGVYDTSLVNPFVHLVNETIVVPTTFNTSITIAGRLDITSSLTLNTADFYIAPNTTIYVQSGGVLNISGANLFFGDSSGIVINNGGSINADSSTLTSWSNSTSCGYAYSDSLDFWNGIIFNGSIADPSNFYFDSPTVEYTRNGIFVNAPEFNFTNGVYRNNLEPLALKTNLSNGFTSTVSGNTFEITSSFDNEQLEYEFINVAEHINTNIDDNVFRQLNANYSVTALKLFTDQGTMSSNIINVNNFQNCLKGIDVSQMYRTYITANTFNDGLTASSGTDVGITISGNADSTIVEDNTYNRLMTGVKVSLNSSPVQINGDFYDKCRMGILSQWATDVQIIDSDFETNAFTSQAMQSIFSAFEMRDCKISGFSKGIEALACYDLKIENNVIKNIKYDYAFPNAGYGVFIGLVSDFEVKDNTISGAPMPAPPNFYPFVDAGTRAIVVENGNQGLENYVFRNNIYGVKVAIQTQGTNTSLKTKCNTTNSSFTGLLVFDELEDQGIDCDLELGRQMLPGNVWNNFCDATALTPDFRDITVAPSALANDFDYWAHVHGNMATNGGGLGPQIRTAPDCNNLVGNDYHVCHGLSVGNGLQIMAPDFCVDSNLYKGWRSLEVEEVPFLAIPQEILDQLIHKQNLVAQMTAIEAQITDREQQRELVSQLNTLYKEIVEVNVSLVKLYEENDDLVSAHALLEQDNTVEAKMKLIQMYISEGLFAEAQRVINEVINISKVDESFFNNEKQINYELNKDFMADILEIETTLELNGRKVNELTASEIIDLEYIKSTDLPIATKAEAMLAMNGTPIVGHTIKNLSFVEYAEMTSTNTGSYDYQLSATPNPASSSSTISYSLPSDNSSYTLKIIDNYQNIGNVVFTADITDTSSKTVTVSGFASGVYTAVLIKADSEVATLQLLIVN